MKNYIAAVFRWFRRPPPSQVPDNKEELKQAETGPELPVAPMYMLDLPAPEATPWRFVSSGTLLPNDNQRIERLAAPVLGGLIAGFPGAWESVNPDFVRVAREYAKELIRQGEEA